MKQRLIMDAATKLGKKGTVKIDEKKYRNVVVNHFKVDETLQPKIKRDQGDYYTICFEQHILFKEPKVITKEVIKILNRFLKEYSKLGTTLIVGLGNSSILADAVGPKVTNKVMATNHYYDFLTLPKVALFVPEVIGKTGISSFRLIQMVVKDLKPDTIIMIDSLATTNEEKLNRSIEISNAGIIPGSALRDNKEINSHTFGIPVIAIGVPTIMDFQGKLYTTCDLVHYIDKISDVLAMAINAIYTY